MEECKWDVEMGKIKEFMQNTKGLKATMFTISVAILIQVGAFLVMWGSLTTTVNRNVKDISKILNKLDGIKIVYAEGVRGEQGIQGIQGKSFDE